MVLFFAVTPGMPEGVERVAHAVMHGDLPHHKEAAGELGCDEHTCTPLFHACGCHASMSAQTSSIIINTDGLRYGLTLSILTVSTDLGRVGEPPPLRPPIAA
jgi:hypothetical protein